MTIQSGNLWCDITDHLPNFCLLRNDNNTIEKILVHLFGYIHFQIYRNLKTTLEILIGMKFLNGRMLILLIKNLKKCYPLLEVEVRSNGW